MSAINKNRANNRQREVLLERVHSNIEVVRDKQAIEFWANLASELNILGCSRTIQEWQHIWNVWVSKTNTKAQEIRRSIHATGGRPGVGADLNETDIKVLEVVGSASASVFGHDNLELGIVTIPVLFESSAGTAVTSDVSLDQQPSEISPEHNDTTLDHHYCRSELPRRGGRQLRSRHGRPRRRTNDSFVRALLKDDQACRETVLQAAHIIAAAISSLRPPASSPAPQHEYDLDSLH